MNLPNKLTVFRVILIVPFVVLLLGGFQQWGWFTTLFSGILPYTDYIAVAIFIIVFDAIPTGVRNTSHGNFLSGRKGSKLFVVGTRSFSDIYTLFCIHGGVTKVLDTESVDGFERYGGKSCCLYFIIQCFNCSYRDRDWFLSCDFCISIFLGAFLSCDFFSLRFLCIFPSCEVFVCRISGFLGVFLSCDFCIGIFFRIFLSCGNFLAIYDQFRANLHLGTHN